MGNWKLYFKTEGDYIQKNQAVYQLYSEDLAIAKHDYFTAFKQLSMPGDFGKMLKVCWMRLNKTIVLWVSNSQIESIKTIHKYRHTLLLQYV
jgi:Cu(I)/Ag(I) efflux system membrane fusion protein